MTADPKILTPAYYQRLYDIEQTHGWSRGMRTLAGALLDPIAATRTSWRILDVGCGTGAMLTWLRRFPGATIVGLDFSADALTFCQSVPGRTLVQGSALELPFPDHSFDLVVSTDVLQHLPNPDGDRVALRETLRVLDRNGYVYIRTNSQFGLGSPAGEEGASYRRYALGELGASLRATGFAVERLTYANAIPSLLAIARDQLTRQARRARTRDLGLRLQVRPASLRWVDASLARLLAVEALYIGKLKRPLPFGHSMVALGRKTEVAPARALALGSNDRSASR
ncbi:MAG: class I SAM-dependent methyltransferase [Chloroflexota bacterium]